MRKSKVLYIITLVAAAVILTAGSASAAALTLSLESGLDPVQDELFWVVIGGTDFPDNYGGQSILTWDTGALEFDGVVDFSLNPYAPNNTFAPPASTSTLTLTTGSLFFPPVPGGNINIARVQFKAITSTVLNVDPDAWYQVFGGPGGGPVPLTPTSDTLSVNVSAVPIPPTVLLLGAGLVGLVGIRRRVKS